MNHPALPPGMYDLDDAVQTILQSPPAGTPTALLESLAAAAERARLGLPAQVYLAAVEQAQMAISITDRDANVLYANPAFSRVTGYDLADVVGKNESMLSDRCTPKAVYRALWETIVRGEAWTGRLVNRRKDGSRYLAELVVAPVVDAAGTVRHYLGMHRDITEMHRLEQQTRNQKALIESVIDAAPLVMALLDEQGRVVLDNLSYKTLAADMGGREPAALFLEAVRERLGGEFERYRSRGRGFEDIEVHFDPGRGRAPRAFVCSGTWFRERDTSADAFFEARSRDYLLLAVKEITELKRRQEEARLHTLRTLTAEQERLQSVRETIGAAIYQLQMPFNLLVAASAMIERRAKSCSAEEARPIRAVLDLALRNGREALATLEASLPRPQYEALARVNLNQTLREALGLVTERLLANGVVVDWQPAPVLPPLLGRENALRGLLKQLLDNAIEALAEVPAQRREITITTAADNGWLRVVIEDRGPGIPDELRIKVFEPFFTTKHRSGHTGMGLVLVQEVVNDHAGTFELGSAAAGGCRVTLALPLHSDTVGHDHE